jgi:hypothetical protein
MNGNPEKQLIPKTRLAKGKNQKKYDLNLQPGIYQIMININDYYSSNLTLSVVR